MTILTEIFFLELCPQNMRCANIPLCVFVYMHMLVFNVVVVLLHHRTTVLNTFWFEENGNNLWYWISVWSQITLGSVSGNRTLKRSCFTAKIYSVTILNNKSLWNLPKVQSQLFLWLPSQIAKNVKINCNPF